MLTEPPKVNGAIRDCGSSRRSTNLRLRWAWQVLINTPGGTRRVRNLQAHLLRELTERELRAERDRLHALGHRGSARLCLLESCALDEPADVLLHHLSGTRLRQILTDNGFRSNQGDLDDSVQVSRMESEQRLTTLLNVLVAVSVGARLATGDS